MGRGYAIAYVYKKKTDTDIYYNNSRHNTLQQEKEELDNSIKIKISLKGLSKKL